MRQFIGRRLAVCASVLAMCGPAAAQWVVPQGSSLDVPAGGTVDLACTTLDVQGSLNLNGGTLSLQSDANFGANASMTGSGGTLAVGGDLVTTGSLDTGNSTLILQDGCVAGNTSQISGQLVVQNLILRSTTGRTFVLPAGANITVLGTLTLQGEPGQDVQLVADSGTAIVNLGPNATVVRQNVTVTASVQIGPANTTIAAIPTLGHYSLVLLSLLMAAFCGRRLAPRRAARRDAS